MSAGSNNELSSFYRFVSDRLQGGQGDVSPEEALDLWRTQYPAADESDDTVLAVQEALQDMDRGDQGVPIEQFDRDFRARHNLRME